MLSAAVASCCRSFSVSSPLPRPNASTERSLQRNASAAETGEANGPRTVARARSPLSGGSSGNHLRVTLDPKSTAVRGRGKLSSSFLDRMGEDDEEVEVQRGADCLRATAGGGWDAGRGCLPAAWRF